MDPYNFFVHLGLLLAQCKDTIVEEEQKSISCYTCGMEEIDPEIDNPGSYGDIRKDETPKDKDLKMYNHTCDIADKLADGGPLKDNWIRKCPPGVKSCFWAEGRFQRQSNYYSQKRLFFSIDVL